MTDGLYNLETWFLLLIHWLIALLVGGVKELSGLKSRKFSFMDLVSGMAVSSVAGVTAYLLLDYYVTGWQLIVAGTIVAGWSGSEFIVRISHLYQKKMGKMMDVDLSME